MSVIFLDDGNTINKAKINRREDGEIAIRHSLKLLTENEYQTILECVANPAYRKIAFE
jgi:FixJ family two-component response regulator